MWELTVYVRYGFVTARSENLYYNNPPKPTFVEKSFLSRTRTQIYFACSYLILRFLCAIKWSDRWDVGLGECRHNGTTQA